MFEEFTTSRVATADAKIHLRQGRRGPALLPHGDPGTHVMRREIVLSGEMGVIGRLYDPLSIWRGKPADVTGRALPCGHFLPEEAPEDTLAALEICLEG